MKGHTVNQPPSPLELEIRKYMHDNNYEFIKIKEVSNYGIVYGCIYTFERVGVNMNNIPRPIDKPYVLDYLKMIERNKWLTVLKVSKDDKLIDIFILKAYGSIFNN